MGVNDPTELLGAYALDACEPEELPEIDAALAQDPELRRNADQLRAAAARLGTDAAIEPPAGLRARVLGAARHRRAREPVLDLYATLTDTLLDVIDALPAVMLSATTANGLSVRDLVVHCGAQESLLAQLHGNPTIPELTVTDIDARTRELIAHFAAESLDDVVAFLRRTIDVNRNWAANPLNRDTLVPWLGAELSRHDALVIRAFESWIHADDLRRARGLPTVAPSPAHLALMSDLSGRTTGFGLLMTGRSRPGRTARLVLTGEGGGEWLVAMGGGEPNAVPDVTVTAHVVDWCRRVGERIAPDALTCRIDGDHALAADLIEAASAFATL